jgi:hypothetical protein
MSTLAGLQGPPEDSEYEILDGDDDSQGINDFGKSSNPAANIINMLKRQQVEPNELQGSQAGSSQAGNRLPKK